MVASVLTNNAAMIALQTLRTTNGNLEQINNQISTGKKVATAKDSAAVFAISKIMESDVSGFNALNESISLGSATAAVAANAANSIGELLNEIKGKIVAANEENVDRTSLNNEISSLRDQISSIVNSAQFNGLNLIDGSNADFGVLSSLNRNASGAVTTGRVELDTAVTNLNLASPGIVLDDFGANSSSALAITGDAAGTDQANGLGGGTAVPGGVDNRNFQVIESGTSVTLTVGAVGSANNAGTGASSLSEASTGELTATDEFLAGDIISVTLGSIRGAYVVRDNDSVNDIAAGIRGSLSDAGVDSTTFTINTAGGVVTIINNGPLEQRFSASATRGQGGLAPLNTVDVTTGGGATAALGTIEAVIQTATSAQAALGTLQKRLEIQGDFTKTLVDSFKSGIGALVDADLEEASARLQALQVQQQLGIQALSIANQAPQNILALFR
ncbi:MAG: flagellin [Pseudomonadota bacterium]